jgi:hypothetical protein
MVIIIMANIQNKVSQIKTPMGYYIMHTASSHDMWYYKHVFFITLNAYFH